MKIRRLVLTILMLLALIPSLARPAAASEEMDIVKKILAYYCHYQEASETDISRLLEQLEALDPASAEAWRQILETWRWAVEDLDHSWDVLPDGLPEDNSLCIIVMGFRLYSGGGMSPELIHRLEVALASAEKYPNAYILCTGGGTASNAHVTEAGQMAKWLEEQGVAPERIIIERRSYSTEDNVMLSYEILSRDYPHVRSIALISSDYHLRRCHLLFQAGIVLPEPDLPYTIVASAGFEAGYEGTNEGYFEETTNLGRMIGAYTTNPKKPILSVLTGVRVSGITEYTTGDDLALSVTAEYDCGYSREVTAKSDFSGFDSTRSGDQVITVTYTESGVTMESTITVTVTPPPTTVPPTTQPEVTIRATTPPETMAEQIQTDSGKSDLWILYPTLGIGLAGIVILCLAARPRRGKYEKRRKS